MKIAIVGAGFSGATIAFKLRAAGHRPEVFESHWHVGGHCATERDPATGVMVHTYGPHIFHTANYRVWNFVRQFAEMMPYTHHVKAVADGGHVFSLPINLLTLNQFFSRTWAPEMAKAQIASRCEAIREPKNFEEQALSTIGRELYEAFFREYTIKQWGRDPRELPASILKRLPIRFNYDDRYFDHPHQAIPREGYTALVENMLDGIMVHLGTPFSRARTPSFDHVFYTGPLDAWFSHSVGRLPYRTLRFDLARFATDDVQGAPVINYCNASEPFTRITEYAHFTPWEKHEKTITCQEYSRECGPDDGPYYPIRLTAGNEMLAEYEKLAAAERNVTFVGRLAAYRYIDMDVAIADALTAAERFLICGPGRT